MPNPFHSREADLDRSQDSNRLAVKLLTLGISPKFIRAYSSSPRCFLVGIKSDKQRFPTEP